MVSGDVPDSTNGLVVCPYPPARFGTLRYTDAQPSSLMKDLISPGANCGVAGLGLGCWAGNERDTDPTFPKSLGKY
jgi:hypothetical protein